MASSDIIVVVNWGKIGDTIHAMIAAQKLSQAYRQQVYLYIHTPCVWLGSLVDHIAWIDDWQFTDQYGPRAFESLSEKIIASIKKDFNKNVSRVVNLSHYQPGKELPNQWRISDWWVNGFHSMDFNAACAGVQQLVGGERVLDIRDLPQPSSDHVLLLPNCGDMGQRGWPRRNWDSLVHNIGGDMIQCGGGDVVLGGVKDCRCYSLWEVVCAMRKARLIISLDTMASANLAESVGTPIVRIHRGMCKASSTGPGISDWKGHEWVKDQGFNNSASVNDVMQCVGRLWDWK